MDLEIQDRVAMVLGAGGGLGGAIADRLAAEGASVAACDVSAEALMTRLEPVQERGDKLDTFVFDLKDSRAADENVAAIVSKFGSIDILVNLTGGPPASGVSGIPTADWSQHFESMVLPVIRVTDRVLPYMRRAGWGRIVTSTSSGVITPIPNLGLSNALRSALVGWSKTLSREVGRDGITVNVVVPGRIATARVQQLDEGRAKRESRSVDDVAAQSAGTIPVGRYGLPREYADVVAFLSSERASFVTGSMIRVDGGMIPSV